MLPNFSMSALSYQKGAISGIKVFSGKLRGMNSIKWVWNETTPLILTCNWRKNPVTLILIGMQQFHYGLSVNQNDWKKQFGRDKCLKLEPFQSNQFFNKFPNCFFFYKEKNLLSFVSILSLRYFLKSQSYIFHTYVGTHAFMIRGLLARRCSVSPSTVLVPVSAIQMASNCWLPDLNVVIAHDCCISWRRCVVEYCIYCALAPSLHRESTDYLMNSYSCPPTECKNPLNN